MLLDAAGNPLRSTPAPAPPPPDPATMTADEAAEIESAKEINAVRIALRTAGRIAAMAMREPGNMVQVPAPDLFALFALAVASVDEFVERRMIDENGIRVPLPDSHAKAFEVRVSELIATVVATMAASREPQPMVQVAHEGALAALPADAERALRGEL